MSAPATVLSDYATPFPGALRLELLVGFVGLAEHLHFTRAAEGLYLSQSGLSRRIDLLERQLGVALAARSTRAVELTAAGVALLPHAHSILMSAQAATAAVQAPSRPRLRGLRQPAQGSSASKRKST